MCAAFDRPVSLWNDRDHCIWWSHMIIEARPRHQSTRSSSNQPCWQQEHKWVSARHVETKNTTCYRPVGLQWNMTELWRDMRCHVSVSVKIDAKISDGGNQRKWKWGRFGLACMWCWWQLEEHQRTSVLAVLCTDVQLIFYCTITIATYE